MEASAIVRTSTFESVASKLKIVNLCGVELSHRNEAFCILLMSAPNRAGRVADVKQRLHLLGLIYIACRNDSKFLQLGLLVYG